MRSEPAAFMLDLDVVQTQSEIDIAEIEAEAEALAMMRNRAEEQADGLLSIDPDDHDATAASRAAVDGMGRDLERRAAARSRMLQAPLRHMSQGTEDGGEVAISLSELRTEVERLDPSHLHTDANVFTRLIGKIPGVGTPLRRYFLRYESSQVQIDSIVRSLERSRDQLIRDNITLSDDIRDMRDLTQSLTEQIALARALDAALADRIARSVGIDDRVREFVGDEILLTVRQRIIDLQQQLTVNQQGLLATEIIIRNNRELIRGVDRSVSVTIGALQVAVTVALALERQQLVLDKIEAINSTTSALIAGTAHRLKTQGTAIHERAVNSMLDMDTLRAAFDDIGTALDEIDRYRHEALPKMDTQIRELDRLTVDNERTIAHMDIADPTPEQQANTAQGSTS